LRRSCATVHCLFPGPPKSPSGENLRFSDSI
jgi:hypothetical protein